MDLQSPTSKKRPFKVFEHSLAQFNDVVIPHRMDMLKKHKCNIEKAIQSEDYQSAIKEHSAVEMLVQNLKRELCDIEGLRSQVDQHDLAKFDETIESSRAKAVVVLEEYINLGKMLSSSGKRSKPQPISVEDSSRTVFECTPQLQIMGNKQCILDDAEEEYVRSWERLQNDIQDLHTMYVDLHQITQDQGEIVNNIEENVETAAEHVHTGNLNLKKALRYKAATYPLVGAAVGALVGGPVGLFIGLKAGGCAAVGGSVLGFIGGKFLKKAQVNKISDTHSSPRKEDSSFSKPHQN